MSESAPSRLRYSIHRLGVEINCQVPALLEPMDQALGEFTVGSLPIKSSPISGTIRPFDHAQVLRHLSPTATRVPLDNDLVELYEENERFWLINDHWGLCEINILKGQWRSWILPESTCEPRELAEHAVLWPAAQLLRSRGLCLVPRSAAVVRDGWAALILARFSLEPELSALMRAGFRLISQSWTALREESGRMSLLHMPGQVQRSAPRALNSGGDRAGDFVDLTSEFYGSGCDAAQCDAILLVAPGRRPLPHLQTITPTNAISALRRAWPIAELHPYRRQGQLPARLAQRCRVFDVQLSRNPQDILSLVEIARYNRPQVPTLTVTVARPADRRAVA